MEQSESSMLSKVLRCERHKGYSRWEGVKQIA